MGRSLAVAARGDDRLDAPTGQPSTQRVAVIAAIGNQAVRPLARAARQLQAEMRRIYRQRIVPRIERCGTEARVLSQM